MGETRDTGERRGFTLIELCIVLAILAGLAALTIPSFDAVIRQTRAVEARTNVYAIAQAELRAFRDQGGYVSCPISGEIPSPTAPFPDDPWWRRLGIHPEGPVRYRYAVALTEGSYVVQAEGDLDGDGVLSRYQLDGATFVLTVEDELE